MGVCVSPCEEDYLPISSIEETLLGREYQKTNISFLIIPVLKRGLVLTETVNVVDNCVNERKKNKFSLHQLKYLCVLLRDFQQKYLGKLR